MILKCTQLYVILEEVFRVYVSFYHKFCLLSVAAYSIFTNIFTGEFYYLFLN